MKIDPRMLVKDDLIIVIFLKNGDIKSLSLQRKQNGPDKRFYLGKEQLPYIFIKNNLELIKPHTEILKEYSPELEIRFKVI